MGMGGAYITMADDGFAAYWNPAKSFNAGHRLALAHAEYFGSLVAHDAIGYTKPMGDYALGLVYLRLAVSNIPYTDQSLIDLNHNGIMDPGERIDYTKITLNDDVESALLINYGRLHKSGLCWGLNLKMAHKSIGPNSAWGMGLDAGIARDWHNRFRLGASLQDITTTYIAWDNGTRELVYPTIRTGASYHPLIAGGRPLALAIGGSIRLEGRGSAANFNVGNISLDINAGIEYWLKNRIAARLGSDQGRFTTGAGLRVGRLRFDYGYMAHRYLDGSSRLSGSFLF